MRILFLGNNWAASRALAWLAERREEIVGVVLHPEARRKNGAELLAAAGAAPVIDGSTLRTPQTLEKIKALKPDIAVSVLFGYILKPELLALFARGAVNVHPAYLPFNRGAYPNVWSIVDGTPAGVTMHYIDPGVDTGDIIGQRRVEVGPADTGETLYRRLEKETLSLFQELWPAIKADGAPRRPQPGGGTSHSVKDAASIDEIELDKTYTARKLIDILRARTFKPHRGAYFLSNGKKIYIDVSLTEDGAGEAA